MKNLYVGRDSVGWYEIATNRQGWTYERGFPHNNVLQIYSPSTGDILFKDAMGVSNLIKFEVHNIGDIK